MVKKYFRPLIFAVCAIMSVSNCNLYTFASEAPQTEGTATVQEGTASDNESTPEASSIPEEGADVDEKDPENETDIPSDVQSNVPKEQDPEDNSSETDEETDTGEETENETQNETGNGTEDETEGGTGEDTKDETENETEGGTGEETEEETANVSVMMTQDIDIPTFADDIRQNVRVDYLTATASKIIYNIDPALEVKKILVGSNTYLEGGNAVITCPDGDKELPITSEMDLSGFSDVTKITFLPKIDAYEGMTAEFTAVLKLKNSAAGPGAENPVTEYSCSSDVVVTTNETEKTFSASVHSKVASGSVIKPVISLDYDGKTFKESVSGAIEFGKDFELNLDKLGMSTYTHPGIYTCDVTTPGFVTLNHIILPKMDGIDKIEVIGFKDKKEVQFGDYASGDKVAVEDKGFIGVRFIVTPAADSSTISTSEAGRISFSNNLESNPNGKTLNASFRATSMVSVGEVDYSDSSKIITVNVKSLKRTEPEQPQTNNPDPGGNDDPGAGGIIPGPSVPKPTEAPPETENPYDKDRKEEEEARKEKIKKQSLQNEQEMKEKMKSILAGRVSQITTGAVYGGGGSTSVVSDTNTETASPVIKKTDKYADWAVKPIFENIVENLVPERLQPITESIIENLVPSSESQVSDSAGDLKTDESESEEQKITEADKKYSSELKEDAVSDTKKSDSDKKSNKKSKKDSDKKDSKKKSKKK